MKRLHILTHGLITGDADPLAGRASNTVYIYNYVGNTKEGNPQIFSTTSFPKLYNTDLMKFKKLAGDWRRKRKSYSSFAEDNIKIPSFQKIIGMGEVAIPYILSEMKEDLKKGQANSWFYALWAITDENPVPEKSRGNVQEMGAAWLDWGAEAGYVSEGSTGAYIPWIKEQHLGAEKRSD